MALQSMRQRIAAAACILGVVSALGTSPVLAAGDEARVLILNGADPYLPAYLAVDAAMRASLADETARRIVFFSETLDAQRFSVEALEPEYVALLTKKYAALRFDVVVVVTPTALAFFRRHGERLWPDARVVYQGFRNEELEREALPPNAIGVIARPDVAGAVEIALRLQPDTRHVVVVSGVSDEDVGFERLTRNALSTRAPLPPVKYLSGLPLPELVAQIAGEPADTVVLYLTQFRDRDGRPYTPREVLRAISKESVAPVYGFFDSYVGFGAAAGSVESYEARGRLVAEQVRVSLAGGASDPKRILLETPRRCVADARQLQHWGLDAARLPDGCEIRFANPPPFWRVHFWQLIGVLAVLVAQSALITALLFQRRRRRIAEAESQKRYSEMAHMNRRVAMGELSASIAHELNQPLGAIHNNAGAAELLIKVDPPKLQEVAEILADIKRDDQRASDVIARIRKILRKTDFEVRDMDLNETIDETTKMLLAEASTKGVLLKSELDPGLAKVKADQVEIQQVILNLVLNAMDAMHDQPADKRVLTIRSGRANAKEAQVSVVDSGPGIPESSLVGIFDPFVTTKQGGMGLGLAISRTIVEAHGGQIRAENRPEGGAAVHFTLPLVSIASA
jgi:signal transduction histidine kinase